MKKIIILSLFFLFSCTKGQHIFYWDRPETGGVWFAKDHSDCLASADYWPYSFKWPWEWSMTNSRKYNLRFDNNSGNGIWAQFVSVPGAQPVYVNSLHNDWTMSPSQYRSCMINKGYQEVYPEVVNRQVFPE